MTIELTIIYMISCFIIGGFSEYYFRWWTYIENNVFTKIEKIITKK